MANARRLAVSALLKVENDTAYSNITLNNIFHGSDASNEEKSLASAIFYGVLDRRITLDYVLNALMKAPFEKTAPYTKQVLRSGLYQIMFMDRIPQSAAVNESVKLIKHSKESRNAGFVNAVLRAALRNPIELPKGDSPFELSVRFSCPERIIKGFIRDYGTECAVELLKESLKAPPTTLRVNNLKISAEDLKTELLKQNIDCIECDIENALEISGGINIGENGLYKKGLFHIQDTASQTAVGVLSPRPFDRVLDMCAAPGGKSFTMAELMENKGEIIACDIYEHRTGLIADGAKRLGLDIIKTKTADAAAYNPELGQFDLVLCDVPCSGLGVIRRKPEIKYKPYEDLTSLNQLQYAILCNASKYLKNGARLLYSTCTLNKSENENITARFLSSHSGFSLMYEHTYMPHKDKTDGFYCALIVKE